MVDFLMPHFCKMGITAYILAALAGVSLGLIGSGGSVLMMPILVYAMGINPVIATSYSLFIVGATSLTGSVNNFIKKQVDVKTAFTFGITSVVVVFVVRRWLLPHIPEHLFYAGSFAVTKSFAVLLLFAILLLFAAAAMIKNNRHQATVNNTFENASLKLLLYGIFVGLVTGLLGAGGGFLIVPVLVVLLKLPVKQAVGTSLFIVALNSLIGFAGDAGHYNTNWPLLLTITAVTIAGIFLGMLLAYKIKAQQLKKIFGWFVLLMGVYIIVKELFFSNYI